jgi:hypothetical protein
MKAKIEQYFPRSTHYANFVHLGLCLVPMIVSLLALLFDLPYYVSMMCAISANLYIFIEVLDIARLSDHGKLLFLHPMRTWILIIMMILAITITVSFANIYIQVGGVVHVINEYKIDERGDETVKREPLKDKFDACYFSFVSLATVGYGDYVAATPRARRYVLWELISGVEYLVFILPVVSSRVSMFNEERYIKYNEDSEQRSREEQKTIA